MDLSRFLLISLPWWGSAALSACGDGDAANVALAGDVGAGLEQVPADAAAISGREFACSPNERAEPGSAVVQRLTRDEYANAILDTLGVDVRARSKELPDGPPTDREFDNAIAGVTPEHLTTFATIAQEVAAELDLRGVATRSNVECDPVDYECAPELTRALGAMLLRGEPTEIDDDAFTNVLEAARGLDFDAPHAVRFAVEAMLQSPRFLYRVEHQVGSGDVTEVRADELATRLSFATWGSAPDAQLMRAAEDGSLDDAAAFAEQVERLLSDERAERQALAFFEDWLDLRRTDEVDAVLEAFPDVDPSLFSDMRQETLALFHHVYAEDLPLSALHDYPATFVSEALARHYGLPDPASGVQRYDLVGSPERGGLLTQGALTLVGGARSSLVGRGLFLSEQILCSSVPEPPANAPIATGMDEQSPLEASQARVDAPGCGACHGRFEPLAWALSRYDALGRYRTKDDQGRKLPESGWFVSPGASDAPTSFETTAELMAELARSPRVRDCALLKLFEYQQRRTPKRGDGCSLAVARTAVSGRVGTYKDMVRALVSTPAFRQLRTEPVEETP